MNALQKKSEGPSKDLTAPLRWTSSLKYRGNCSTGFVPSAHKRNLLYGYNLA